MMHQPIDPTRVAVELDDRPMHEMVIQKDEITDLTIDLETKTPDEIIEQYFN